MPPEFVEVDDAILAEQLAQWKIEVVAAKERRECPPPPPLNHEQRKICRELLPILYAQRYYRMNNYQRVWYAEKLKRRFRGMQSLLLGPAGTGKTEMLRVLEEVMLRENLGTVVFMAWTGVAASLLPHGMTTSKLLGVDAAWLWQWTTPGLKQQDVSRFEQYCGSLEDIGLVVLDEISFNPTPTIYHVSNRMQQLFGVNEPFGGVPFVAPGDFHQLT